MKKQNGITLIALVITIIVMLILVGVSVSVALNGGLFTTANKATENTATERDKELNLSDGKVEINGQEYNSIDEYVNGGSSNNPTEPENPTGYAAYVVGDEVKIGEEYFYVLKDSDETNPNVTLLAKDNIDTTTLEQSSSSKFIEFSSTNYWSTIEGITYTYDLIETGEPDTSHKAARAAYDYGAKVGGKGRLMIYSEATALERANSDILYGANGKSSSTYLIYWLGSAEDADYVRCVLGHSDAIGYDSITVSCGVRPVVEISKSNIS